MIVRLCGTRTLKSLRKVAYTLSSPKAEGYPNGKEAVLKTAGRKPMQVRVLSPPPSLS